MVYNDVVGYGGENQRMYKLRPCRGLAYVIGSKLGDGYTKHEGKYHYAVVLAVGGYDFAGEFSGYAAIAIGRESP